MLAKHRLARVADLIRDRVLSINDGFRAKNSELSRTGIPFARAGNIDDGFNFENADCVPLDILASVHNKCSRIGDVVFTSKGTVGRFAFVREDTPDFVYSPQLCYWRSLDDSVIDPRWLYYWMQGREFFEQYKGVASQTDMAEYVSLGDQRAMAITIPNLANQRAVAFTLGALDDKIELNRRMNATLEEMARALFQSWFVDFDPVRAKLDGRQLPGLDPATAALFPNHFQDSTLRQIPIGWKVGSILEQADLLSGGTPKTDVPSFWDGDIPWASAKDVSQCGEPFLVSTDRTISKLGVDQSSTKILPALTTVVVARGATTGRLTMFGKAMAMNQTCYGLRSRVNSPYALYCHACRFTDQMVHAAHGSVFDTITTRTFQSTDVLLPPEALLRAFDTLVAPLFARILVNIQESRTLAEIRDTLLPKLLSGELSGAKAEELAGAAI